MARGIFEEEEEDGWCRRSAEMHVGLGLRICPLCNTLATAASLQSAANTIVAVFWTNKAINGLQLRAGEPGESECAGLEKRKHNARPGRGRVVWVSLCAHDLFSIFCAPSILPAPHWHCTTRGCACPPADASMMRIFRTAGGQGGRAYGTCCSGKACPSSLDLIAQQLLCFPLSVLRGRRSDATAIPQHLLSSRLVSKQPRKTEGC